MKHLRLRLACVLLFILPLFFPLLSAQAKKPATNTATNTITNHCAAYKEGIHYQAQGGTLTFVNWANYIGKDIIPCFEQNTGIHVNYLLITDDNMTQAKLLAGHTGFDVTEQGALYLPKEIRSGALMKLDHSRIPNFKYRNPILYKKIAEESGDPNNDYAIAYSYGTTGIGYNVKAVQHILGKNIIPNNWKYIFNPYYLKKFQHCGISILNEPEQVFGNLLFYLNKNPNSNNPQDYIEAAQYFIKYVRPYITYFDSNRYETDLAAGNLCLSMGYSGDILRAMMLGKEANTAKIKYVIPKTGTAIFFDMLMIPKGSKHIPEAYQFLSYMMNPKVAANNSNKIYQPNAALGSTQYASQYLKDPNVTPSEKMLEKMYNLHLKTGKLEQLIERLWFDVQNGIMP